MPRLGQVPLKKELDKFCKEKGIKPISASTIAKIIRYLKDKNEIINPKAKISFYAKTGKIFIREKKKKKKLRKGNFTPHLPGDLIQMDSIHIFIDGIKRYIFSAIDIHTKFAFAFGYNSLTSSNAKDFMKKLRKVARFKIKRIQTDNGSEFAGDFEKYTQSLGIIHFYNYPQDPESNAYVERFNRTFNEHFIEWNLDKIKNIDEFNFHLVKYLIFYNTKKPHSTLNNVSPLEYFIKNYIKKDKYYSKMYMNYTRI